MLKYKEDQQRNLNIEVFSLPRQLTLFKSCLMSPDQNVLPNIEEASNHEM